MLNEFNLINMNGRVYDPVLGWFLSPDKYVQEGDNSQNYNSYSYCLNNPLKYADLQSFIGNLDETAMKVAANFAYEETIAQKTIPYSEILNVVKEELEWKKIALF